jgi:uroporphyrinogen decarboxylase
LKEKSVVELNSGERVVRCLIGEPVDRVPFGIGLGWRPWGNALELWREQSGIVDLDPAGQLGTEASFARPKVYCGLYPPIEHEVLEDCGAFIVYRDHRGIIMRGRKDGLSMPEFVRHPVQSPDDWERIKGTQLRIDEPGRIAEDWDAFRARLRETGEAVQVGDFPFGLFGTLRDLLGVEELLVSYYTQPDMIRDMIHHLTTLWLSVWSRVAESVQIDHIHIWEDMSGKQGSLISPRMVREFMMPGYDRIADFADAEGVRLMSVDSDGDCSELVPIMMEHGVNFFFPFEVQASNDVREYRRRYPSLGINGGLDKRALAGSRADVDLEIERARDMLPQGRYLPAFDHLIPPDAKWENLEYAAQEIRRLCSRAGTM